MWTPYWSIITQNNFLILSRNEKVVASCSGPALANQRPCSNFLTFSFSSISVPLHPFPSPLLSPLPFRLPSASRSAPLKTSYRGSGERCKLPQRGPGQNPGQSHFAAWYALKTHLVALISVLAPQSEHQSCSNWPANFNLYKNLRVQNCGPLNFAALFGRTPRTCLRPALILLSSKVKLKMQWRIFSETPCIYLLSDYCLWKYRRNSVTVNFGATLQCRRVMNLSTLVTPCRCVMSLSFLWHSVCQFFGGYTECRRVMSLWIFVTPCTRVLSLSILGPHYRRVLSLSIFNVRRYALHGICDRNSIRPSVRPSVRLSVRLSVTLVDCVHTVRPTIMISSPYGSPIILVSGISSPSQNSKGITPSKGVEWGWGGYELAIFDQ